MHVFFRNPKVTVWFCYVLSLVPPIFACIYLMELDVKTKHHNWGCGFGIIAFTGNGLLMFRLFPLCKTVVMKCVHFWLILAALAAIIYGMVAAIQNQDVHFRTFHGTVGLIAVLLYCLNFIVGLFIFLYVRVSQRVRRWYTGFHAFFGFSAFFLGILGITSGVRGLPGDLSDDQNYAAAMLKGLSVLYGGCVYFILLNPCFEWEEVGNI